MDNSKVEELIEDSATIRLVRDYGAGKIMENLILDKEKNKWDYYYDAMEYLDAGNDKEAEVLLKKAIKVDGDFVAGYLGMVSLYKSRRNNKKVKEYTNLAFQKTKKKFPKWPKEMPWGVLKNRQYLRSICGKAILSHENKQKKEAEELYRLLLKLNPNDNQGVRYLLAALYAGKDPKIADELIDKGNRLQNWDELENFLDEQNRKHNFWE